jgi:CRISPR/Cas system CSM-associated protein Csm3 (group 7 of RAMP superfamily)
MATINFTLTLETGMRPSLELRDRSSIPATQVKGRLRASCEQIARMQGWRVCNAPDPAAMCHAAPCVICRLFGSGWREGSLYFQELTSAEPLVLDRRVRARFARQRGVLEHLEKQERMLIPAGTQFQGSIHYDFPELGRVALVVAGLNAIRNIGGGWGAGDSLCLVSAEARDRNNRPLPLDKLVDVLRQFNPDAS